MATALYRRYRPESFSDMIGQAHVTEPLMAALRTERIGHAYLFSGPRGCGKTSSARILARCLNCAEGPTDKPCGTCPSCVELGRDGGGSLDVVEIDAASHGGVDDARDLRERAVFAPARDRFKIFIIDEAHMVTAGGFNALLKIVEEPPPHVKFVFATTEPEKVIGTIRSRTHHYPFRLIAPATLIEYVQQICEAEGVEVEDGVLPLVVRAGGGSVRDTLSILDQLIAGSEGGSVTIARATGLLGYTSSGLLDEVIGAIGARDAATAFAVTDRVVQTGLDPRRFVEDLLERLRDLIVVSATTVEGASSVFRGVPVDQLQRMFEQAQAFRAGELSRVADTVSAALDRMTGATAPRLHLELMIARTLAVLGEGESGGRVGSAGSASAAAASGATAPSAPAPSVSASSGPAPRGPAPRGPAPRGPAPDEPAPSELAPRAAMHNDSVGAAAPRPEPQSVQPESTGSAGSADSTGSTGGSGPSRDALEAVAAMKSAREFLRGDSGGTGAASAGPVSKEPANTDPVNEGPASAGPADIEAASVGAADVHPVAIEELRELWPELLDELLSENRDAWNAVKVAEPLALEGDLLTIGLASRSDLEAFKASGADPLREAILAATGVNVRYQPRSIPARPTEAAQPAAYGRESASDEEPSPTADPYESSPSQGSSAVPASEPAAAPEPIPEPEPTPESVQTSEPGPAPEPEPTPETALAAEPAPAPGSAQPTPASPTVEQTSPPSTRYGESVVREVLGARFIEERPLT